MRVKPGALKSKASREKQKLSPAIRDFLQKQHTRRAKDGVDNSCRAGAGSRQDEVKVRTPTTPEKFVRARCLWRNN